MNVKSVGEVTKYIKKLIENEMPLNDIFVKGEISNFKKYASGHCYFTLKDAYASIRCVMFKNYADKMKFAPQNGINAIVFGRVSVYERDGAYQLYVETIQPCGIGDLALAFSQLKEKLSAEGLFDESRKKTPPFFPKTIGVITSLSGAVLRDIHRVAKRRNQNVRLVLYPVQVQGTEAAAMIKKAIKFFNEKYPVDTIIVGRGGGSMEDLQPFNEEIVVRAIAAAKIPIISAVGHETDFTLADFAADVRAATPSQAAELAVPDAAELKRRIDDTQTRIDIATAHILNLKREQLTRCTQNAFFKNPKQFLAAKHQALDAATNRLNGVASAVLDDKRRNFLVRLEKLDLLNPAAMLKRGYAIAERRGKIVKSIRELKEGDDISVTLSDGKIYAAVQQKKTAG